jgi:hypothetical protein
MVKSEISAEHHFIDSIRRLLNIPMKNYGMEGFPKQYTDEEYYHRVNTTAGNFNFHRHGKTCHKGKMGVTQCRMGMPQTIVSPSTRPTILINKLRQNRDIYGISNESTVTDNNYQYIGVEFNPFADDHINQLKTYYFIESTADDPIIRLWLIQNREITPDSFSEVQFEEFIINTPIFNEKLNELFPNQTNNEHNELNMNILDDQEVNAQIAANKKRSDFLNQLRDRAFGELTLRNTYIVPYNDVLTYVTHSNNGTSQLCSILLCKIYD